MVIIFSNRKSKTEKELIKILTNCGADLFTDNTVINTNGNFVATSVYKHINISSKKGIALILDDTLKFKNQKLPYSFLGLCEDQNITALKLLKNNHVLTITCGNNCRNTVTISSFSNKNVVVTIQRTITDLNGKLIYPADYNITLKDNYSSEAVMFGVIILLMHGITPKLF